MLIISLLYDLSERQTEAGVNDTLSAKWFLGLAVDEAGLDHSTLTRYKERIEKQGKEAFLGKLVGYVIAMAMSRGVTFGTIQTRGVWAALRRVASLSSTFGRYRIRNLLVRNCSLTRVPTAPGLRPLRVHPCYALRSPVE